MAENNQLQVKEEVTKKSDEKDLINRFFSDISRTLWEHEQIMPNPRDEK